MDYVIMGFGAVLVLVGILLFIKGVQESQSTFKGFGISFNITNPGIVIFIVGCVMFMTPYILDATKKPVQLETDKIATGEEAKLVEEERKRAEKERLAMEEAREKMKEINSTIEAEKEKLAEEVRRVKEVKRAIERELAKLPKEERRSKEQELAKLKREVKEKEEKARLAEEIAKAEEAKRIKEQEIAKLQEEVRRKREEAKASIEIEKRRRLEEETKRLEKEELAKEKERCELETKIERKMEIAKGQKELAGFTNLIIQKAEVAPVKLIPPDESKREHYPIDIGAEFGDRDVFEFKVTKPGLIKITAEWTGETERLALILNGPGQVGYYVRRDGSSPLIITYDVSERILNRGTQWQVSVVNFTRKGHAAGKITIEYP